MGFVRYTYSCSNAKKHVLFELSTFEGYCLLTSSFFNAYMTDTEHRLLQAERDKTEDNTIILHDFFYKNYDLKIKYDPSDPLKPFVEFDDQIIGSTAEASEPFTVMES